MPRTAVSTSPWPSAGCGRSTRCGRRAGTCLERCCACAGWRSSCFRPAPCDRRFAVARFASFREFYPFYLAEHANRTSRRLHFIGSCGVLLLVAVAIGSLDARWLLAALLCGYGFAWVGHFFFEKNRPATFRHPFYSFAGAWVMFSDILSGRIPFWVAPDKRSCRGSTRIARTRQTAWFEWT